MRVLLIDDHAVVRRGIRSLLEESGSHEVCGEAEDGSSAAEIARREKPDAAIVDFSMPGLNGVETARQLKLVCPDCQILIFTQYDDQALLCGALQAGARGFVHKSEAGEHLLHALAALAMKQPYFSGEISELLLASFVEVSTGGSALTRREEEIVKRIADAYSSKEIARQLNLSVKTVEAHRASVMRKLNLKNLAELVRYAVRQGLVRS
ncbi:response regulator [Enterovirga sp. CN4-39]|uniref:response regulator n=1 Tax=Enterovirga sp. CN4-39 TaxID=3400910 RepID=UPI003C0A6802